MKLPTVIHDPALFTLDCGNLATVVDLDRDYSAEALFEALKRLQHVFPILGCRYERRFWRDRWRWCDTPLQQIARREESRDPDADLQEALSEAIDPLTGPSMRVTLLRTDWGSRLVLNMTHMLVDGSGLLTTMHELAGQLGETGRRDPPPMNRSFFQLFRAIGFRRLGRVLKEMFRDSREFTRVLGASRWSESFETGAGPAAVTTRRVAFSEETSRAFKASCKAAGATVNDGFVAEALRLLCRLTSGDRVAVAYTVNMRKFLPTDDPIVGNMSGFLPVTTRRAVAEDPAQALPFVSGLIGEHKKGLPGVGSNLLPISTMFWLPHGLLRPASHMVRKGFLALGQRAMVMTNVGAMDAYLSPFGSSAIDAWVTPPTFPGFPAPISLVSTFRDRMSVCVGGPAALGAADVARVATAWEEGVGSVAPQPIARAS